MGEVAGGSRNEDQSRQGKVKNKDIFEIKLKILS